MKNNSLGLPTTASDDIYQIRSASKNKYIVWVSDSIEFDSTKEAEEHLLNIMFKKG